MSGKPGRYDFLIAILVGLIILLGGHYLSPYLHVQEDYLLLNAIYLVTGLVFGFVRPARSWRWGIWIFSPTLVFLGFGMALFGVGNMALIFKNVMVPLLSACGGGFLGAKHRIRRRTI